MIDLLPATADLVQRIYGEPPKLTYRAYVALENNEVVGLVGLRLDHGRLILFSKISDALRKHPVFIVKVIKKMQKIASGKGLPLHAVADKDIPKSEVLLERVGFVKHPAGVYVWPNSQ